MPTLQKFHSFVEALHEKQHNLSSDSLKWILTSNAPSLSWTQLSDVTGQLSTANGYTQNDKVMTVTSSAQSSGLYTLIATDVTWTASGGNLGSGSFRYAILYNETSTNDLLIGYLDYSYLVTVATGQTFTLDFDAVSGLYYAS
jgi:hypothetical protein